MFNFSPYFIILRIEFLLFWYFQIVCDVNCFLGSRFMRWYAVGLFTFFSKSKDLHPFQIQIKNFISFLPLSNNSNFFSFMFPLFFFANTKKNKISADSSSFLYNKNMLFITRIFSLTLKQLSVYYWNQIKFLNQSYI